MGNGFKLFIGGIIGVLIATASWAVYAMINHGIQDLLSMWGIHNLYLQYGIVIFFVLVLLFIVGYGGRKAISNILGL